MIFWIFNSQTHRISGDNRGWVDEHSVPYFSSNVTSYIAISPLRDGASGHFKHLVHVQIHKKQILPLTHGKFEVTRIVYWDQVNYWVYFLGIPERHPGQQHLFRVSSVPPKFGVSLKSPRCLTCTQTGAMARMQADLESSTTHTPVKLGTAWDGEWDDDLVVTLPAVTTPTMSPASATPKRRKKKGIIQLLKFHLLRLSYYKAVAIKLFTWIIVIKSVAFANILFILSRVINNSFLIYLRLCKYIAKRRSYRLLTILTSDWLNMGTS